MKKYKNIKILLVIAGAGVVAYAATNRHTTPPPVIVPMLPISQTQSIGGTPTSDHRQAQSQATVATPTAPVPPTPTVQPVVSTQIQSAKTAPAENEFLYRALGTTPNDPLYSSSWALQKVNAAPAWNVSTGTPVVVAVIDTGFALQHEDLKDSWYKNPGETGLTQLGDRCWTGTPADKSSNTCDDDNNGYTDDWRGWNFYGTYQPTGNPCAPNGTGTYLPNNNPMAGQTGDATRYQEYQTCTGTSLGNPYAGIGHGTATAGLAGATTNNGIGIASVNWNTKIMPLQALGDDGSGWTSDITDAIRYAVDNGAQIINLSLGGEDYDAAMKSAVDYAYAHNVVVVASAGNCGTGLKLGCSSTRPGQMMYPALMPHVIAVGATDQNDTRASFSSYGRGLDVVAPGYGTIASSTIDTRSQPFNYTNAYSGGLAGTSFSSPIVASVASLIRSLRPGTSADDIIALIDATARKPSSMGGTLFTTEYGHGVVDANTAATIAARLNSASSATPTYEQTGNFQTEHSFRASDTLPSSCTTASLSACTVHFSEEATGYDRYLPYRAVDTTGQANWLWSGSLLDYGAWWGRAQSGDQLSRNDYVLLNK